MSLRQHYTSELEQLRLQVELMAVRVAENLERMRAALDADPQEMAAAAVVLDRDVDAMNVSLTERCYELIIREAPVATDARLILSVIRLLNELERISDHAVMVCETVPEDLSVESPRLHDLVVTMTDEVIDRFGAARRAFGSMDLELAEHLSVGSPLVDALHANLIRDVLDLEGADAISTALAVVNVARSLERICDHTSVVGARLRYLITGDPAHLAAELR